MKQLRGLYEQTFFTFRTTLVLPYSKQFDYKLHVPFLTDMTVGDEHYQWVDGF